MEDEEEARRKRRRKDYLNKRGIRLRVDSAPVRAHVRGLKERGMAVTTIARRSGLSVAYVAQLANGYRMEKGVRVPVTVAHIDKVNALMGVRYEEPAGRNLGTGSRLPAFGAQRRIQALARAGFPLDFQGRVVYGFPAGFRVVQRILKADGIYAATLHVIQEGYDKYSGSSPAEVGVAVRAETYIRHLAERREWAPAHCWTDWTIDDPDAIPDWTGYCGTGLGMKIHKREGIPVCGPCKEAYVPGNPYPGFDGEKLRELRERAWLSREELGRRSGLDGSTIQYWETNRSRPYRGDLLDRVLHALDATYEDVCDPVEGT